MKQRSFLQCFFLMCEGGSRKAQTWPESGELSESALVMFGGTSTKRGVSTSWKSQGPRSLGTGHGDLSMLAELENGMGGLSVMVVVRVRKQIS